MSVATKPTRRGTHFRLVAEGITDIGLCRVTNEDAFLVDQGLGLMAVFDGMGGSQAGEVASTMAGVHLRENLADLAILSQPLDHSLALARLNEAMVETNRLIFQEANQYVFLHGMGTTATTLLAHDGWGLVAHVGDSRLYRIREHECELLTQDHTLANELISEGHEIENYQAFQQFRRMLTKTLGTRPGVEPDLQRLQLKPLDRFVLCSDGLSEYLNQEELIRLTDPSPPGTLARRLVKFAKKCGGADNITVIVADAIPTA